MRSWTDQSPIYIHFNIETLTRQSLLLLLLLLLLLYNKSVQKKR